MQKEKNDREELRSLIFKQYQSADLNAFDIGLGYLMFVKIFVKILFFVWAPL